MSETEMEVPIAVEEDSAVAVPGGNFASETDPDGSGVESTGNNQGPLIPDELDILRRENSQLLSEVDRFRTQSEKHAKERDKFSGEYGTRLDELRRENSRLRTGGVRSDELVDDPSEGQRQESSTAADPRVDQLIDREQEKAKREDRAEAQRAYSNAVGKFDLEFPNLDKEITANVAEFVSKNQKEIKEAIDKGDPLQVESVTERLLTRAMKHAISERRKGNSEAEKDRQDQLVLQKRDASAPGRQSPGSNVRGGRGPTVKTATLDELRAEYRRRGRKGF